MSGSQAFWVILVPWSIFGWGRSKLFYLFEISFPWTFQWYIWSYSVNTYFPIFAPFWVWDRFLGGAGSGWGRTKLFCSFWNLLYMDFPMVFDTTILNEHPFLIILKGRTNLWVGWEVDGVGQFFFILNTPLMVDNYCIWYQIICLSRKLIDRWMYPGSSEILAQLKLSRCKCLVKNILKLIMEPIWPKKLGSQSWIFKYI